MNNDKTLINKLWWLNKFLNEAFEGKTYPQAQEEGLNVDICNEVDEIVKHIKQNY